MFVVFAVLDVTFSIIIVVFFANIGELILTKVLREDIVLFFL